MTSCSKEFTYGIRNETGTTRDVYIYEYNKDNEAIVIHNSIVENRITKLYDAHRNTVKIKTLEEYGTLYLNIKGIEGNAVVQLLNSSDAVVREQKVKKNNTCDFYFLQP